MADIQDLDSVDGVLTRIQPKKAKRLLAMLEMDFDDGERPLILAETFSDRPRHYWIMLTNTRFLIMTKGTVIGRQIPVESTLIESSGGEDGILTLTTSSGEIIEIPLQGGDHHTIAECAAREGLTATVIDNRNSLDETSLDSSERLDIPDAAGIDGEVTDAGELDDQVEDGSRGMAKELADLGGLLERGVLTPDEYTSAVSRLVARSSTELDGQPSNEDVPEKRDNDHLPLGDAQIGTNGDPEIPDEIPFSAPNTVDRERVILDEQGYIVTPSRLFVPPDKVFNLAQVVSCDLQQSTDRVVAKESRDSNSAFYAFMAAVVFGIGLALSDVNDGWLMFVALIISVWLLTKTRKHTVYAEKTTSWVKVAYSNRSDREVLVSKDTRFAKRLHDAIVQAIGPE